MNGRFPIILILFLCGAFLFIAGCSAPAPSGGAAPTPTVAGPTPQAAATTDLGTIESLLTNINDQVSLIAANTRTSGNGIVTGNIVLFDSLGNMADTIPFGTSVVALPQGTCDIAVYGDSTQTFITVEELNSYTSKIYSRNYQACAGVYVCRQKVTLDNSYSYLYLTYKPYDSTKTLTRVTLSYRCNPS